MEREDDSEREVGELRALLGALSPPAATGAGLVRTFFVFTQLPKHIEWRASDMPVLPEGTVLELDMGLKNPRNPARTLRLVGSFSVVRRKLIYSTVKREAMGLTQYLELSRPPM